MWETVVILFFGGVKVWSVFQAKRERLRIWQAAAESNDLVVETTQTWVWSLHLKAHAGPLEVRFEDTRHKDGGSRIVVVVRGPLGFTAVKIRREWMKPPWAREIEVGDKAFDGAFYVVGPPRLLCALLDAETRHLLIDVNAESRGMEIVDGEIRAETSDGQVSNLLRLLLEIGRRLAQPLDAVQRLAENTKKDPKAGVRLRNLILLVHEFPGEPGTTEALRTACSDASAQIRLRAAKELGAEGRGVLVELAENTIDDATSAQAISILGQNLPPERTRAILAQALRRRHVQTARACLEALGDSGAAEDIGTLAKVMALEKGELAAAAAKALGSTGSPAAEPPLVLALQRAELADLQVAAANALARAGTTAAVLPLKELAEHISHHPEIRKAARQAIAEIQSRLPGASPGQLSLAGTETGQLSLAQAEPGQLSLASEPGGELSLPAEEVP